MLLQLLEKQKNELKDNCEKREQLNQYRLLQTGSICCDILYNKNYYFDSYDKLQNTVKSKLDYDNLGKFRNKITVCYINEKDHDGSNYIVLKNNIFDKIYSQEEMKNFYLTKGVHFFFETWVNIYTHGVIQSQQRSKNDWLI